MTAEDPPYNLPTSRTRGYVLGLGGVVLVTILRLSLTRWVGNEHAFTLFYPAVLFAAWLGIGPGIAATAVSVVCAYHFWMGPQAGEGAFTTADKLNLGLFVFVAISFCAFMHQLRRSRLRISESEQRFRVMADVAPVLIWMANTTTECDWFNKAWLEFTGRRMEEETGNGWTAGVHSDDLSRCLEMYLSSFKAHQPFTMEFRLRRHDGEFRWLLDNGRPRYAPGGGFEGFIGTCVDITDLKTAEEALRIRAAADRDVLAAAVEQKTRELRETVSTLESFSYSISHDLKAPLRAITAYSEVLLEEEGSLLSPAGADKLGRISKAALRLNGMIGNLLDYTRTSRGEVILEPISIDRVFAQTYEVNPNYAKAGAQIISPLGWAIADPTLLTQCFVNLVENGCKYTQPGSPAHVTVRSEDRGSILRLWFEDRGVGIAAADHARIFEMFQRLDHRSDGSGLGLAIVKRAVERMNATVGVESTEGAGARFWIDLKKAEPRR